MDESSGEELDGSSVVRKEAKKSNAFDGANESRISSSSDDSDCDSAKESATSTKSLQEPASSSEEKNKSKDSEAAAASGVNDASSSGDDTASSDEATSSGSDDDDESSASPKQEKDHSTPTAKQVRLSFSSKEKLKNAVAEKHDENKRKGVKPSVEGNVFNARSPAITISTAAKPASEDKASRKTKGPTSMGPPATAPVPKLRMERSDAPPPSPPLRHMIFQPQDAVGIQRHVTAGPNPPEPRWESPGKGAGKHNLASTSTTPHSGKRNSSGHLVFSSSVPSKESSPQPETEEPKAKSKKDQNQKQGVEVTGHDIVLAEAKKQAARLTEHTRLKKIRYSETSFPAKHTPSSADSNSSGSESDAQSSEDDESGWGSNSETSVEKPAKSKKGTKRKDQDEEGPRHAKKQKQKAISDGTDDLPTTRSSKKSKKRKRDDDSHARQNDAAVEIRTPKKAKKLRIGEDAANDVAEVHVSNNKAKKRHKRKSDLQANSATESPDNKPCKSPKQPNITSEQRVDSPEKSSAKKKSKKEKKKARSSEDFTDVHASRQRQVKWEATNGNGEFQQSSSFRTTHIPTTQNQASSAAIDTTNPDINNLLTHLKLLIPRSILECALVKLNSANKDLCSKRKLQYLQKSTSKEAKQEASNSNAIDADYYLDDNVTVLSAVRDLLVSLSGKRLGMNSMDVQGRAQSATNMSPMELELGRIAMERQWENERLQEQVRNLQARIQRFQV